jgi:hypothetical protein
MPQEAHLRCRLQKPHDRFAGTIAQRRLTKRSREPLLSTWGNKRRPGYRRTRPEKLGYLSPATRTARRLLQVAVRQAALVKEVFVVDAVTSKGADGWPPIQLGRNHADKAGRGLDSAAASDDPGVRSSLRSSRIAPRCHLLLAMPNSKMCQAQKATLPILIKKLR